MVYIKEIVRVQDVSLAFPKLTRPTTDCETLNKSVDYLSNFFCSLKAPVLTATHFLLNTLLPKAFVQFKQVFC